MSARSSPASEAELLFDEDDFPPRPAGWTAVRRLDRRRMPQTGVWRVLHDDGRVGVLKVVRTNRGNVLGTGTWELAVQRYLGDRVVGVLPVLASGATTAVGWRGGRTYWVTDSWGALSSWPSGSGGGEEAIPLEDVASGDAPALLRGIVLARMCEVATSLARMHALGVIHGDVKPGNLLTSSVDRAAILDFDTARTLPDTEAFAALGCSPWETVGERRFGTPMYMTPEMAAATQAVLSPASDVYSLGATLYPLLWRARPYERHHRRATVSQVISVTAVGQVLPPRDESDPLWPLVSSMLSRDPGARPAMGEVARALAEACGGIPAEGE